MRLTAISAALFAIAFAITISGSSVQAATITKTSNHSTKRQIKQAKVTPPVQPQQTIIVSAGDNLSKLATTYNTTMLRLFYANANVTDPNLIYAGEVLVVPSNNETLTPRQLPQGAAVVAPTGLNISSAPAPVAASAATLAVQATPPQPSSQNESVWDQLANCESGGDWSINTGNGFYGGLQFSLSSWQAVGGVGYPNQASPAQQIAAAEILQSEQGWAAWPVCSVKIGL